MGYITEKIKKILKKHEIYILLFIMLFIPVFKITSVNPYIIWKIDKSNPNNSFSNKSYNDKTGNIKKQYYKYDNTINFYSKTGKIISKYKIQKDIICTRGTGETGLVLYSQGGDTISFLDKKKGILWKYKTYAYPFLTFNNNLIILITGENGGYGTLKFNGDVITEPKSSGMLLTSFSIPRKNNLIFIGYLNGYVKLFDNKLNELWFKQFSDSNILLVKKTACSSSGNYFAVLSGLNPEYITLMKKDGRTLWKKQTGENRRRPIELKFSSNEKYLLEEGEKGVRLYSVNKKKKILDINLFKQNNKRQLISMDLSHDGRYIIVSYKINEEISAIQLYDNEGVIYFTHFFENEKPFVAFAFNNYNFQIEINKKIYLYNI